MHACVMCVQNGKNVDQRVLMVPSRKTSFTACSLHIPLLGYQMVHAGLHRQPRGFLSPSQRLSSPSIITRGPHWVPVCTLRWNHMDKCRRKKLGFNLKYSKEKNKSEKMNTLVLLDYDDTLIPSTKLQNLLKLLNINKRKKDRQNNENMAPMEINKLSLTQTDEVDIFFDNIPITLHDKNIKEASNSRVSNLVADTSLPTQSNYPFSNDIMVELKQAETAAVLLLKEIYLKGLKMVIISNAEIDWIWYTLNCFFPSLHNIIKSYDIAVVSARDNFEEIYRDKPELWKIACFRQQFQHHFTASFTAPGVDTSSLLVSIGDSLHERFAAQTVGSEVENVNILSIKLLDTPNHDILTKQLRFISSNFGCYLINESNDLFVQVRDDGECYYVDHKSQEKQVSVVTPVSIALDNKHMKTNGDRFAPLLTKTVVDVKKRKLGSVIDEPVNSDDAKMAAALNYKLDFENA